MDLSIIIPTYNRKDILEKCLLALKDQDCQRTRYEIIIVDDGSSDDTRGMLDRLPPETDLKVKYYRQDHKGPAAARNLGIKKAEGMIVFFFGDDMMASRELIKEHMEYHGRFQADNVAVLGNISWPPGTKLSPFLKWLECGAQFGYSLIKNPGDVSYKFFYSSNISLKKQFLLDYGLFDEDFRYAAYEDIELGYRLKKHGLRILYDKEAKAYHEHDIYKASFMKRTELAGRALKVLVKRHPELEDTLIQKVVKFSPRFVLAFILWNMPQWLARIVPRKLLYAGYGHMSHRHLWRGYGKSEK